ncbi:hypothetical protein CS053_01390 [Rhodanobacter glycinis]|uniref:Toxin VasX N-terminal region domain-containing protein n=1 Tax=Rhodanobacter glycinis TaxID=582702 RepID=A0A5B9DUN5_9GAMM|nr:T6SS effector BTH_I2691 family protein [Rhodanobacter glycinis]QEE23302.1 hypothetical protein CS053_01390 [Rhodanobacter glycinis]
MADGQGYSGNAQKSAAGATVCSAGGCPDCIKQGLPVLLVIPTLADKSYAQGVKGTIAPLLKGIADPVLTQSGYVMRTLREGYVMAWYEKPPKGMAHEKGWTIAKVHSGGYLTQTSFAALGMGESAKPSTSAAMDIPFTCSRTAGYASALLFVIPRAGEAGKVWVAFSNHPWSPGVRKDYAADKDGIRTKGMTCIDATAGTCKRSTPLTVDNLQTGVVDFASDFQTKYVEGNPYPLRLPESILGVLKPLVQSMTFLRAAADQTFRPETAPDVYAEAKKAIGEQGKLTISNAMIVGLADPEGCTTTAAQRRITLCNTAAEWVATFKDDNGVANGAWRLQSALTVKGLLDIFDQQAQTHLAQEATYDANLRGQTCTQAEFAKLKASGKLPPDATLERVPEFDTPMAMGRGTPTGWHEVISFPAEWTINTQRDRLKEQVTERLTGNAKGKNWQGFLADYESKVKADRATLVEVEKDHRAWLESALFNQLHASNFSDSEPRDGVPYARCVNNCLMGGPITKNALAWWAPFLASDPAAKNNLLVRAMLGNQQAFFDWFKSKDTHATAWDEAKGLLDVVSEARKHGGQASHQEAEGIAQSLLGTSGALAARMDAAKQLDSTLRGQLKRLGLGLIAKSESDLFLYRIEVPLGAAGKLWRNMASTTEVTLAKTVEKGGRKVKSLVMGGVMALELQGSPSAADKLAEVYLWSRGKLKVNVGKLNGKFQLSSTEVLGERQTPFAIGLTEETAAAVAKNSMRLLRSAGSGVLSAGSGFLQVLVLGEAWEQFEHGTKDDQQAAAVTLLTSGIGMSAAFAEITGAFAKQFEKEALEKGLKMFAARASAVGTAIGAVQSFFEAGHAFLHGDENAAVGYAVQAVFFFAAAGAGVGSASAIAAGTELTAVAFGLSWTGIGLIFVALGALTGLIILLLKDTPLESWAAQCIWGKASDKYSGLAQEQDALNKVMLGVEVDFSYGAFSQGTFLSNLITNMGVSQYNQAAALSGQPSMAQTLEARLCLMLPKVVKSSLPWLLQIHAAQEGHGVAEVARWGSAVPASMDGDSVALGLYDASHKEEEVAGNDKVVSLVLSVRLDEFQYRNAYATVRVADAATSSQELLSGDGGYIINEEHLTG